MGNDYTLIGFIVIVLGGLGHPVGALVGALLFGVTEQVSVVFFNPSIATICGFTLMVAMIFVRPSGLFGRQALRQEIRHVESQQSEKRFGGLVALQGVDVHVPRGAILGVIGMNGSGKTTMLNCINGIYTPDEGRIELDGRDIAGRQVHEVARLGVGAPSRCRASSAS